MLASRCPTVTPDRSHPHRCRVRASLETRAPPARAGSFRGPLQTSGSELRFQWLFKLYLLAIRPSNATLRVEPGERLAESDCSVTTLVRGHPLGLSMKREVR